MFHYEWLGKEKRVTFKRTGLNVFLLQLEGEQPFIMGCIEKTEIGWIGYTKGVRFEDQEKYGVSRKIMDFMHQEAKKQQEAFEAARMGWDLLG